MIDQLIAFEKKVEETYKTGVIKGPIHLRGGNEAQLVEIFKSIRPNDYVFATWANHLEAILKGIPEDRIMARIIDGESMAMNFPEYRFYTSAIVGGICSIAVGVALGLPQIAYTGTDRVFCFIGDMALRTGIAHESIMYAAAYDLPITFVVADNGKSVGTPTQSVWGSIGIDSLISFYRGFRGSRFDIIYYKYELEGPHSGVGSFISF